MNIPFIRPGWPILSLAFCLSLERVGAAGPAEASATEPSPAHASKTVAAPRSPEGTLQQLLEGNERFVAGQAAHPRQATADRANLAKGQSPSAIILTCADSRVVPEFYFDQGFGDLFVLRNAGNVLDDHVIGSMEYAIEHLHVSLVVVVGHGACGAVSAAVQGAEAPGHIRSVVESILPALEATKNLPGDPIDNAVRANAKRVALILHHVEPLLKPAAAEGRLKIVAARYDLQTGKVEILK